MSSSAKTVAVIGAGPVGLAAAAHALERGMRPVVLEAGEQSVMPCCSGRTCACSRPGRTTSTRRLNDCCARKGWNAPDPDHYPTGAELVEHYLEPLATRTPLKDHVRTRARVISLARAGFDKVKTVGRDKAPFEIRYQNGHGPETFTADAVIDASGTWHSPNPAGVNGTQAIGEAEQCRTHRLRHARRPRAASANAMRARSSRPGRRAFGHWDDPRSGEAEEKPCRRRRSYGSCAATTPRSPLVAALNDKLAARGELGRLFAQLLRSGGVRVETGFPLTQITRASGKLRLGAGSACCGRHVATDELIVATGFRPDLSFLRELRLALDPALECPPASGAPDRSQPAQLRHRASAWRARTGAAGARLLLRRHEILRPRADLPDDDRLRAGALDRGRHRRRQGRG